MRVTQHETSNDVLSAPPGMSHAECTPAPVTRVLYLGGVHCVRTYWRPTPAEMRAVAAGRPVWVEVHGNSMPPMVVGVEGVEDALSVAAQHGANARPEGA